MCVGAGIIYINEEFSSRTGVARQYHIPGLLLSSVGVGERDTPARPTASLVCFLSQQLPSARDRHVELLTQIGVTVRNICIHLTFPVSLSLSLSPSHLFSQAPPPAPILIDPLQPDNVYAVYCERVGWWAGSQWCRAWLLNEPEGQENSFFALDFGFTVSVPLTHIQPLPPECRGVPPQV